MKLPFGLPLLGLCGAYALVFAQNPRGASDRPLILPTTDQVSVSSPPNESAPVLTRAEALQLISDARRYTAHPPKEPNELVAKPKVTTPDFDMAEPPPAPRSETKPEAPGSGYVWVEGHYMPVKGQWRWVRGEWAVPALPISVWISARYDAKAKTWSPGYWQPDVTTTVAPAETLKDGKPAAPPSGY
jgi:WXXGXW repeat (2 copies)